MAVNAERIYLNGNEHLRAHVETELRHDRMNKWIKQHYHGHELSAASLFYIEFAGPRRQLNSVMREAATITTRL